jgi:hypothetical protein
LLLLLCPCFPPLFFDLDSFLALGLIYLKDSRNVRPPPETIILVNVKRASHPNESVMSAQIPVANQRLPIQFQFSSRPSFDVGAAEDLLVDAQVCRPEDVNVATKSCKDPLLAGSGLAKALQFQSPEDPGKVVRLRSGVSVALQ